MTIKAMSKLLEHVQRLGSGKDVLSGILASCLAIDRGFTKSFFDIVIKASGVEIEDYFHAFPENYGLCTAERVSKKRYAWIEDKRIAFAPDIWIFDQSGPEWDEIKAKPSPSFHFLIECKENARISKGQARAYPFFEDDLFGRSERRVFTLLVHGETTKEEQASFSYDLNWIETLTVMEEALESASGAARADLEILIDLYHSQLAFRAGDYQDEGDSEAAHALLEWFRSRLPVEGTIEPRGHSSIKPFGKWLCIASEAKLQLWLRAERKEGAYFVQVEAWAGQAMSGKPIKLPVPEDGALKAWNALLVGIMAVQQKFAEGLA